MSELPIKQSTIGLLLLLVLRCHVASAPHTSYTISHNALYKHDHVDIGLWQP